MSLPSSDAHTPRIDDGSPQESSSQIRLAPHPFDKPCADIILRTCDRMDFRVRRHILIESSPVFDSMFTLPQPQTDTESPHAPIIDLAEDSGTIETLLRICYPIRNPALDQPLDAIETMLRAAMKYEMELPTAVLTDHLLSLAERTPMPVWAVACRLHLEDVAKHAAEQLRNVPSLDFNSLGGMDGICAGDYFRLREFHRTARFSGGTQLPFRSPPAAEGLRNTDTDELSRVWPPVPFPDDQPPTVICRSSDGVEFGVHKDVLCAVSSRFLDDIGAAEFARDVADAIDGHDAPANTQEMKLPTVQVNARAAVLAPFLRLCYPRMETHLPYDLQTLADLLCLAEKYHTDAVAREVERLWESEMKLDSFYAYCVAVRRGLRERAQDAARVSLDQDLDGMYLSELEDTPALAYHRLLAYHASCRAAATGLLESNFPPDARSGTYVVKVHSRTTHSRTEFPRANPPPSPTKQPRTAEPKTPYQDEYDTDEDDNLEDEPRAPRLKEVQFTPKDSSRIYALRRDPSVVSLLNMYDDNGCLDVHAFASSPPTPAPVPTEIEGRQPRPRTGSTLRQLLGEPQPTFTEHTHEGDISWAERFLDERLHDDSPLSSPASMALETPKDILFSDDLSPPRVAPVDTTLSSMGADSSINYPAISSMEVEVSKTMEDVPVKAAPAPKPIIESKTLQRASEVFGFLNHRNTVIIKECDLPEIPQNLSPQIATDDISTHDTSLDALHNAIHSANTSHSASNNSSDAPSHLSHAQIHTATMTKLSSAFAASTLSLNLLTSYDEGTDKPAPSEGDNSFDNADAYEAQPAAHTVDNHVPRNSTGGSVQAHGPRHHHTGSSLSSSSTMNLPPSKIPRGPRPRPLSISRRDELSPEERNTHAACAINMPSESASSPQPLTSRAARREAFTNIPQRRHHRIASRSSESASDREEKHAPTRTADALKTPGPSTSHSRKRSTGPERRATTSGKENTPSPPRASPYAGGAFGLGFATPSRARTLAGHLLGRGDMQVPPSPASSSELSPVGQDMMNNLRKQRMRARQVERRKGFWVRE